MAAKIISGVVATISLMVVAFVLVPSFWFWAAIELLAALLVAYGCIGEWYLHHHPAGRAKHEKDAHHRGKEVLFIGSKPTPIEIREGEATFFL